VALGCNLGHCERTLTRLRELFGAAGLAVAPSRLLVTRAVGVRNQPDFLNQVLRLDVPNPVSPQRWLQLCRAAERTAGRLPTYHWGPRRADVDLLLLGERGEIRVDDPDLAVPHPRLGERPFLCALLDELDHGLRHPDGWRFAERAGIFLRPERPPSPPPSP
jgi:2-amino-4-hydroxy-6-hydroxymethyldihydropteridine diphosphokinase